MKRAEIAQLLPGIFQRAIRPGNPLFAALAAMETLQGPDEEALQDLEQYFDPYRMPDAFVPYISGWLDLDHLLPEAPDQLAAGGVDPFPPGLGRLRELIAAAAYLSGWRGTERGLLRFLETATGTQGFEVRENVNRDGEGRPFHLLIQAPPQTAGYEPLLRRIIEVEKPAYVTYELAFRAEGNGRT